MKKIVLKTFFLCSFLTAVQKSYSMDITSFKKNLSALADQLYFSSESDYPFEILDWGNISDNDIQKQILVKHPGVAGTESLAASTFFGKCIRNAQASGDEQMKVVASRYEKLQAFIQENAASVEVLRCGKIEVGVYIVMRTKKNEVVVLRTTSIET